MKRLVCFVGMRIGHWFDSCSKQEIERFIDSIGDEEIVITKHRWMNERLARIQIMALVFNVLVPIDITLYIKNDREVLASGHATIPFSLLSIFHRRSVARTINWLERPTKLYTQEAVA